MGFSYNVPGAVLPIDLSSQVTNTLPIANGGTGLIALGAALQHLRTNAAAAALEYTNAIMEVIETHEAVAPESSFVFNFTGIDFDDIAYLVLEIDIGATAQLQLDYRINTIATASYFSDGRRIVSNVETLIDDGASTAGVLCTNTLLSSGNITAFLYIVISLPKAGGVQDRPMIISSAINNNFTQEQISGILNTDQTEITDVEVRTSASTWRTGTRMTLYQVRRS